MRTIPLIILSALAFTQPAVSDGATGFQKARDAFLGKRYGNAIVLYNDFLRGADRGSEEAVRGLIDLSQSYYELGAQYFRREKYEFARQLFYSANSPEGDTMVSKCVCKIAEAHFRKNNLDKALKLYKSVNTEESRRGASSALHAMGENERKKRRYARACSLYCQSGTSESKQRAADCLSVLAKGKGYKVRPETIRKWVDKRGLSAILTMGFAEFLRYTRTEEDALALLAKADGYFSSNRYWDAQRLCERILGEYADTQAAPPARDRLAKCKEEISQVEKRERRRRLLRKLESSSLSTFLSQRDFSPYEIALTKKCLELVSLELRFVIENDLSVLPRCYGSSTYYAKFYAIMKLLDSLVGEERLYRAMVLNEQLHMRVSTAEKVARISSSELE